MDVSFPFLLASLTAFLHPGSETMCCAELQEVYRAMSVLQLLALWNLLSRQQSSTSSAARDMEQVQNYTGGILSLWLYENYFIIENEGLLTVPV